MARLFLCRSPRTAVNGRSAQWFGTSPRRAIPEGHTTSITRTAPQSAHPPSFTRATSCVRVHKLQPHYRTFLTTTSRPVPVPRLGTLPLAVSAACGPPSRGQPGTIAQLSRPTLSGRQVLLFHASARDELTPPLHRAPPGQHAGRPLAEGGRQQARAFVPEAMRSPGFDAIVPPIDASAVVHTRSSSRRTPDPLIAGLFPQRSPPRLLTGAACGGLGSPPALANPEGQTPITGTARFMPATFYIAITPLSGHTAERRIWLLNRSRPRPRSVTRSAR